MSATVGRAMLVSSFYPLRSVVGDAIEIRKLGDNTPDCIVVDQSKDFNRLAAKTVIKLRSSLGQTLADPLYEKFLPEIVANGRKHVPGDGMGSLPLPRWQPFPQNAPLLSIFCLGQKELPAKNSRNISLSLRIRLGRKALIGGICFAGLPYLPYRITGTGENSSNSGIPRGVRVTCLGSSRDDWDTSQNYEFLDSEISSTTQETAYHSGFHFVLTDPTLADTLLIRLSDFPLIVRKFDEPKNEKNDSEQYDERFGFALPYLYVFDYRERTRYRPLVSGGFSGGLNEPAPAPIEFNPRESTVAQSWRTQYRHFVAKRYYDFTAHAAIGTGRTYVFNQTSSKKPRRIALQECFISEPLSQNQKVVLHFEQGEEYTRCISGMRAFFPFIPSENIRSDIKRALAALRSSIPNMPAGVEQILNASPATLDDRMREALGLPEKIRIANKIRIRVFELDPNEGASSFQTDLGDKYAILLADRTIGEISEIIDAQWIQGVKFVRPSTARYFAIEITNLTAGRPAHVVLKSLELVQSAHVSMHSRAARIQQIKSLHFRIIGNNLAEDYAALGGDGFNFTVEQLSAGDRKNILFRANTMLDLLHAGAAHLFANSRRRAKEFENVSFSKDIDTDPALGGGQRSYDIRHNQIATDGWRRSETGSDRFNAKDVIGGAAVTGRMSWYGDLPHWNGEQNPNSTNAIGKSFGFSTLGNREVRTHSDNVYPEQVDQHNNSNEWNAMRGYLNSLGSISSFGVSGNLVPNTWRLGNGGWTTRAWMGIPTIPLVSGQRTFAVNPLSSIIDLTNAVDDIIHHRPFDPAIFGALILGNIPLLLSGGGNSSVSVSPGGLGISIGFQPTPTINYAYTVGSFGNVTTTASEENYSYAQSRGRSFDETRVVSYADEGIQNRLVTHKEVPGSDAQRIRGAEVLWQGEVMDILSGTIPINLILPATADKNPARTYDETLRVRIGSGVGSSVSVDIWFDVVEELIRDDN